VLTFKGSKSNYKKYYLPLYKMNDWKGNKNSIYKTLGASNHSMNERQGEDYYATDPKAAKLLLELESFSPNIWECACGEGHLSNVFIDAGYNVKSTDLVDRGFGESGIDFLSENNAEWNGDIITNPPYKYGREFVEKALQIIPNGMKVAMFLKLQFMEGKGRKNLFTKTPPKVIYVSSSRLLCAKNAEFQKMIIGGGSAVAYGWYVWEKGIFEETKLKWFN
jgi:hypothetical protein